MNKRKDTAFEKMGLKSLSEYIEKTHHAYELSSLSAIENYFNSISEKDRALNPNLDEIKILFIDLTNTFRNHVSREEKFVNHLIGLAKENKVSRNGFVKDIDVFKSEHVSIYKSLQKIKELTNNYKVDENSSAVLKLCCARLFDFEQDLLKHQYLEEQYLFPQLLQRLTNN
ncbi:MAG: hemerythrin domain-containing protein [Bacteroidia bacterium]